MLFKIPLKTYIFFLEIVLTNIFSMLYEYLLKFIKNSYLKFL